MELIVELLFNCLGEFLLQVFGELLIDYGLRSLVDGQSARRHPFLSFVANVVLGLIVGGLSLLIFPHHFVQAAWARVALLVIIPLLAGWMMSAYGQWRAGHGRERASLERFGSGFAFALAMGLVRFCWAK